MGEKAFLIDATLCIGCGSCQVSCKDWNKLPAESNDFFQVAEYNNPAALSPLTWNRIAYYKPVVNSMAPLGKQMEWSMFPLRCNHCFEPNCLKVCPENAIYKVDGWTVIDQDSCIGCGACEQHCVYNAVHVLKKSAGSLEMNKAYKCHGCSESIAGTPVCARSCPTGALVYDYRLKLLKMAKARISVLKKQFPRVSLYGVTQFNGMHVLTILKDRPSAYSLPEKVSIMPYARAEEIKKLYILFSFMTFGSKYLKRKLYGLTRLLVGNDRSVS